MAVPHLDSSPPSHGMLMYRLYKTFPTQPLVNCKWSKSVATWWGRRSLDLPNQALGCALIAVLELFYSQKLVLTRPLRSCELRACTRIYTSLVSNSICANSVMRILWNIKPWMVVLLKVNISSSVLIDLNLIYRVQHNRLWRYAVWGDS